MATENAIISSLEENPDEVFLEISQILIDIIKNILSDHNNLSYRTLNLGDANFTKFLGACGAMESLFYIGFIEDGEKLYFPTEQPLDYMQQFSTRLVERRRKKIIEKQRIETEKCLKVDNALIEEVKRQFIAALVYKDESLLEEARTVIPLTDLKNNALKAFEQLKASSTNSPLDIGFSDCLLYELLKWFKQTFFKWVNAPECDSCKSATRFQTTSVIDGLRTECYMCDTCKQTTYFKRYQDPRILLKTRKGRCGEWANTFTLFCCALGWDARLVVDKTDHVWTEVYSGSKNRWVHCDPCETALDTPLMYEIGWKKELSYVFAYSPKEVQDVTWRYSKNHKMTLSRRKECDETVLAIALVTMRQFRQELLPKTTRDYLEKRTVEELVEMLQENKVKDGDEKERQSGSIMWRMQRGEASIKENVQYKWKPVKLKKWLCVRYNIVQDCYEQIDKEGIVLKQIPGWQNGAYKSNGLFRKEEFDWNNVYLARLEGLADGAISWKFESLDETLVIDSIDIKFQTATYENGKVALRLVSDDHKVHIIPKATTYSTREFSGKHQVCLIAKLTGGRGDVAWQHAQLFRQTTVGNVDDCPFLITIKFKSQTR